MSRHLAGLDIAGRAANPCVGRERADLVLSGCAILDAICATWPVGRLRVADRGIREGILFDLMHGRTTVASDWRRNASRTADAVGRRGDPVQARRVRRVKSARRRKPSSTEWLKRQLNDPYVAEAHRLGYRSRAAFKLIAARRAVSPAGAGPARRRSRLRARRLDPGRRRSASGRRGAVVGIDLTDDRPGARRHAAARRFPRSRHRRPRSARRSAARPTWC